MNKIHLWLVVLTLCQPAAFARHKAKVHDTQAQDRQTALSPLALTRLQQIQFDSLYFEALSMQLQDKSAEAMRLVSEALTVDSLSAPALYFRSRLYRSEGNPLGLHDAELAARLDSTNYWYSNELGEQYVDRHRFDLAIPCYERLQRIYPDKSEPCYSLAELYLRGEQLDSCLRALDRIEELDGINPNLTLHKFYILKEQGKTDEAFREYEKLIERFPFDISYRIRLGDLQMQSGMLSQAKHTYDEAARIDPDNAYLWIAQSNYYSVTGNQPAADSLVQCALLNANLDIDTKIKILTEYLNTALQKVAKEKSLANDTTAISLPEADSLFVTVATMHPTSAQVYNLHADYLSAIHQDSLALVQVRFAVDLQPSESSYWSHALTLAAQVGDFPLVFQLAQSARRLHPALPEAYLMPAYAYSTLQQPDSALACYDAALQHIDKTEIYTLSIIWGYKGDVYSELGKPSEAYACYDKALVYNERNYAVLNNYAYHLCTSGGDLMKAESMAAKVVQQYPDVATYLDTYAWIFYLQGNYTLAKIYQQKALEKAGDNPDATLVLHYDAILKALGE